MSEAEDTVMNASEKMREVNALLHYHAEKKKCEVEELQWKVDKGGHIHIRDRQGEKEYK